MNPIQIARRPVTFRAARVLRAASLAGVFASLAACGVASDSNEPVLDDTLDIDTPAEESEQALPRVAFHPERAAAGEQLARKVASALRDATVREALYRSMTESPVKEGKLHLGVQLRDKASSPLGATLRVADESELALDRLLETTGPLEIYVPVKAHREQWKGDENVIVAVQLDEKTIPFGVDLDGEVVELSPEVPPEVPVISVVPAESFEAEGTPRIEHLRASIEALSEKMGSDASEPMTPMAFNPSFPGLWITSVHIQNAGDYEGWLMGDPEFEMHLQNLNNRSTIRCSRESSSTPWRWNMNSDDYSDPFLLAEADVIPDYTNLVIAVYEDDDTACKLVLDKDYLQLTTKAVKEATGVYQGVMSKNYLQAGLALYNLIVTTINIIKGEDDFVGLAAGTANLGTMPTTLALVDPYMSIKGYFTAQLRYMCVGNVCGGAAAGCYCDAACVQYGDCCYNACSVCGAC